MIEQPTEDTVEADSVTGAVRPLTVATAVATPPARQVRRPCQLLGMQLQSNAGAAHPQRLRMLSSGVILANLIFGVVGALIFGYFLSRSPTEASARQLIRVQKIQTDLLTADATATNAFLIGGLERPAQRATYDQAITEASALIAESARAQPADGAALSALNDEIVHAPAPSSRRGPTIGRVYRWEPSTCGSRRTKPTHRRLAE